MSEIAGVMARTSTEREHHATDQFFNWGHEAPHVPPTEEENRDASAIEPNSERSMSKEPHDAVDEMVHIPMMEQPIDENQHILAQSVEEVVNNMQSSDLEQGAAQTSEDAEDKGATEELEDQGAGQGAKEASGADPAPTQV